jgi:hypothetical protein
LQGTLLANGFASVAIRRRAHPAYDLWAVATLAVQPDDVLRQLAAAHFPN